MSVKRTFWSLVLIVVLASVSACAAQRPSVTPTPLPAAPKDSSGQPAPKERLKIRYTHVASVVGITAAAFVSVPTALFWPEEKLDVELSTAAGGALAPALLVSGKTDITNPNASQLMQGAAKDDRLRGVYFLLTTDPARVVVPADSTIKTVADFKGKRVAVREMGTSTVVYVKGMLKAGGLDPEKDVQFIPTGTAGPTLEALKRNDVDILALIDTEYSDLLFRGVALRKIESPIEKVLLGSAPMTTTVDVIKNQREALIRLLRGIAKGTVFAQANPEAAVKIHWKLYPDTKPKGMTDEEALKSAVFTLSERLKTMGKVSSRWGDVPPEGFQAYQKFLFDSAQIPSIMGLDKLLDLSLLDEVNRFDEQAVIAQAKAWKE